MYIGISVVPKVHVSFVVVVNVKKKEKSNKYIVSKKNIYIYKCLNVSNQWEKFHGEIY